MFNFTPSTIPSNVFVIGAGGTGGRLIPMLSQFMRSITRGQSPQGWLESPRIWLVDDDTVEQKNLLRQNFIERDVGKHKAAVLAERYTKAYGVDIVPVIQRITTEGASDFYNAIDNYLFIKNGNKNSHFTSIVGNSIVVICVDSVQARRDILNTFICVDNGNGASKTFFVDAGNEDNFGQVTFFTPTLSLRREDGNKERDEAELPKLCPVSADVDYIPMNAAYYRDLVDTPAQGSCADLNQTLAINAIMATTIMGVLQNYFYRKPMSYCGVSLSLNGGNITTHNTMRTFNNLSTPEQDYIKFRDQRVVVKEKDGTSTPMSFGPYCQQISSSTMRTLLVKKMSVIKAENERLARVAAQKALEEETARRIKVIADRKRAEIRAQVQARLAAAAVVETAENSVEPVSTLVKKPKAAVAAPALVATPRVRGVRNVVELTVPAAWVPSREDDDENQEDDGYDDDDL